MGFELMTITLRHFPPENDDDFERLCLLLLREYWNCPDLQMYGRRGQRQDGVDIVDLGGDPSPRAAQCKKFNPLVEFSPTDVFAAAEEARSFRPPLRRLEIMTTAKKSVAAQQAIAEINRAHRKRKLFRVRLKTWDEIEFLLRKFPEVSEEIYGALSRQSEKIGVFAHGFTYSGHPVCCAVGVVNVGIIEQDGLVERAAVQGGKLLGALDELRNLPNVGDVRGLGMMCGVELVTDKSSKAPAIGLGPRVAREAMARGLLLRIRAGSADPAIGDTICLAPPLMTPEDTLDRIPQIIRESIIAAAA